ncbi:MAG: hypothetical protein ACM3ZF_14955 [Mycobacterium leprae]
MKRALEEYKRQLLEQSDKEDMEAVAASKLRGPWASGAFYLLTALVLLTALAVIARTIDPWVLPVVIAAAVVLLTLIGALQLRQDGRLSQKRFAELIRLALGALPLLLKRDKAQ